MRRAFCLIIIIFSIKSLQAGKISTQKKEGGSTLKEVVFNVNNHLPLATVLTGDLGSRGLVGNGLFSPTQSAFLATIFFGEVGLNTFTTPEMRKKLFKKVSNTVINNFQDVGSYSALAVVGLSVLQHKGLINIPYFLEQISTPSVTSVLILDCINIMNRRKQQEEQAEQLLGS